MQMKAFRWWLLSTILSAVLPITSLKKCTLFPRDAKQHLGQYEVGISHVAEMKHTHTVLVARMRGAAYVLSVVPLRKK